MRLARDADLDRLQALESLFPSDAMSRRSLRRFIHASSAVFLVAEVNDEALGNLLLLTRRNARRTRIYSLIVDPAARGLGLAQQLVQQAETVSLLRGCSHISLEVRADNQAARTLYNKLGYSEETRLPNYYDDGADGLRLGKTLSSD